MNALFKPPLSLSRTGKDGGFALKIFGAAVLAGASAWLFTSETSPFQLMALAWGAAFGLTVTGVVLGVRALRLDEPRSAAATVVLGVGPVLIGAVMTLFGALLAMGMMLMFARGRQLRHRGRIQLPPVVPEGLWANVALGDSISTPDRLALAAEWRANGQTEHASVAAFAQLTLQLMDLGAPPRLVIAAQKDALDEIRHTELCFSLARCFDGKIKSPGPFPAALRVGAQLPRVVALARLAVSSLIDGALHEGLSARVIAQLSMRCEVPAIREVLKEIARDEGRHAAHGWHVVEWCLAEGGAPVAQALRGAIAALPQTMQTPRPPAAASGGWEKFGIHGHALEAEEFAKTRADLLERLS